MRLIDLSRTVDNTMAGVSIAPAMTFEKDGWNATTLSLYSHSGTHVDAPIHFEAYPETIDQMPIEHFSAEAWVIDCLISSPGALIKVSDLGATQARIQPGDGLIFRTGWSDKYGTPAFRDDLPRISEELALWIVDHQVKLIGVEPPSVADVNNLSEVTSIHQILLGGRVTIVEGLINLSAIQSEKVWILALPLKIKNGDGCPVRAVAIVK